jgi:hypothetical protein
VKVIRERWDAETTAAYDLTADPFERSPRAPLTDDERATLERLAAP